MEETQTSIRPTSLHHRTIGQRIPTNGTKAELEQDIRAVEVRLSRTPGRVHWSVSREYQMDRPGLRNRR